MRVGATVRSPHNSKLSEMRLLGIEKLGVVIEGFGRRGRVDFLGREDSGSEKRR